MESIHNKQPLVIMIDDAISQIDCVNVLSRGINFNPSLGFDYDKNQSLISNYRSSSTAHDFNDEFNFLREKAINLVKNRFNTAQVFIDHSELVQLTRYEVGQEYKQHVDYFNQANTTAMDNDRCGTVIFYLNDDFEGGETYFPYINLTVKPKKGSALFFAYDYDISINSLTTHAGLPVLAGVKNIATVWIHYLPYQGSQPEIQ